MRVLRADPVADTDSDCRDECCQGCCREEKIDECIRAAIDEVDPKKTLAASDYYFVVTEIEERVKREMREKARTKMNEDDKGYIVWRVNQMVQPAPGASCDDGNFSRRFMLVEQAPKERSSEGARRVCFQRSDRVVCKCQLDGQRRWASGVMHGVIQAINSADVSVMIDGPNSLLVTVPECDCHLQRTAAAAC